MKILIIEILQKIKCNLRRCFHSAVWRANTGIICHNPSSRKDKVGISDLEAKSIFLNVNS